MKYRVQEYAAKNGSKGLILSVPGATEVSFYLDFRAGYLFTLDYDKKAHVPHVLEHILAGSTKNHPTIAEFDHEMTKNGAYTNAFTNYSHVRHVASCAKFEWERVFGLLQESVCQPNFDEKIFKSEIGNVRSELTHRLSDPFSMMSPKLGQAMGYIIKTYPEFIDSLDSITLDDVKKHYNHTYRIENMRFIISGDFEDEREQSRLTQLIDSFGLQGGGRRFVEPADKPHRAKKAVVITRKDVPAISFEFSTGVTRRISDADTYAILLLNRILTGGMASKIYGKARQEGAMYGCSSICSANTADTEWAINGRANADKLERVFDIIFEGVNEIKEGNLDASDLEDAKNYYLGKHYIGIQTANQLAGFLARRYFFDGFIRDYDKETDLIKSVTKEQIIDLAREFFAANIWGVGFYGNIDQDKADQLRGKLKGLFDID